MSLNQEPGGRCSWHGVPVHDAHELLGGLLCFKVFLFNLSCLIKEMHGILAERTKPCLVLRWL